MKENQYSIPKRLSSNWNDVITKMVISVSIGNVCFKEFWLVVDLHIMYWLYAYVTLIIKDIYMTYRMIHCEIYDHYRNYNAIAITMNCLIQDYMSMIYINAHFYGFYIFTVYFIQIFIITWIYIFDKRHPHSWSGLHVHPEDPAYDNGKYFFYWSCV